MSLLPETAPFPPEEISALNRIMGRASSAQRHWLAGFLAGFEAGRGTEAQPAPAAPAKRAPLLILYATESGNAEALAESARKAAARRGFAPRVLDMADASPADLAKARNLLVIASTWGEGDPPQRAAGFLQALVGADAPRLGGVRYSVLALGDRAYVQFCATGRRLDERLAELGAERVADRVECDLDYDAPAGVWTEAALGALGESAAEEDGGAVIHVDFARATAAAVSRSAPFAAEILEHGPLASSRSASETFHLGLSLEGAALAYEPGDSLGVVAENDPALVAEILAHLGAGGDTALASRLAEGFDVTTLTRPLAESYARTTGDAALAALLAQAGGFEAFAAGRQAVDLFAAFPHPLGAEEITALFRKLPPRYYSIASSRKAVGEEAHLTVARLAYQSAGRAREGVASGFLARRRAGERVRVFLKPNPHFRLPADATAPVIMIGPGTGVAPFRAFLQEREAAGATGRNWLFFGHRHFTHDFLYQTEMQAWRKSGLLSRLDLAFSRDQPEKIYVQDRLWQARAEVFAWIGQGAYLYVCGDAAHMARDVEATLLRILAEEGGLSPEAAAARLAELSRAGRYRKDVY